MFPKVHRRWNVERNSDRGEDVEFLLPEAGDRNPGRNREGRVQRAYMERQLNNNGKPVEVHIILRNVKKQLVMAALQEPDGSSASDAANHQLLLILLGLIMARHERRQRYQADSSSEPKENIDDHNEKDKKPPVGKASLDEDDSEKRDYDLAHALVGLAIKRQLSKQKKAALPKDHYVKYGSYEYNCCCVS